MLQRDREVPLDLIPRLKELGIYEVWVRCPSLEFLEELIDEGLGDRQRDVYHQVRRNFEAVMRKGMEKADWKGFSARRAASLAKGKWRGIGMATYVEKCGGGPPETAIAKFNDDNTVTIFVGNQTNGQGQETAIRQIASARLGIDADQIHFVQGDSDVVPEGMTGGSRMVSVAGTATIGVADKIIAKGKLVAASAMEVVPRICL